MSLAFFDVESWRVYLEATSAYQLFLMERFRGFGTVMMVSVRGLTADVVRGLHAGADYYLPKPFHPAELLAVVGKILDRSEAVQHASAGIGRHRHGLHDIQCHRVQQ